ncbi:AaceriABL185Cp [[Ashbya] aceris (nom. inval.)]|nr:AaceriABL185Cp [[Ashbya] aceris (nom. inval.)]
MSINVRAAVLLVALAVLRLYVQPVYSLISDCDETFNYWEPLNLLVRGFGKQTWEYSPEYSIRSWAFLMPLQMFLVGVRRLAQAREWPTATLFYAGRAALGLLSLVFEKNLYLELVKTTNTEVAEMWLVFQLLNPGWFHASVELLPSSLAMVLLLGYLKDSLRYLSTDKEKPFVSALFYLFLAGLLGWPFVLVLGVPLVLHYVLSHRMIVTLRTGFSSVLVLSMILGCVFAVDSVFYRRLTLVPWNIVKYNVLGTSADSGPHIFGTEPWYYYVFSLLLNLPVPTLMFALVALLHTNLWPVWCSLFAWLVVFIVQPHKEERFMYPIYAFVTLASSIGFTKVSKLLWHSKFYRHSFKAAVFAVLICQSVLRITALVNNYTAPLHVYSTFEPSAAPTNVCTGREWYHFPASFFLPDSHRLRFVKSGFDGLLPGDFPEEMPLLEVISQVPEGMNQFNRFDAGKVVPTEVCDYYVDIMIQSDPEKDVFDPTSMPLGWEVSTCAPFIDATNSSFLGRAFQIPSFALNNLPKSVRALVEKFHRVKHVQYCVFKSSAAEQA